MIHRFIALITALMVALALPPAPAQAAEGSPNVVLILVDDMRADDLAYMPFTRHLFANQGVRFSNGISPHPLCCPARAELLTGQYAQNNGVYHNTGPRGGWDAMTNRDQMLPEWFKSAGYKTAFIGKFLNLYKGGSIPGLTNNDAFSNSAYSPWNYTVWNNGDQFNPTGHQTDYIARRTDNLINSYAATGSPFFIWSSYVAPHIMRWTSGWEPSIPPTRYSEFALHSHRRPPSLDAPSYNEENMSDKPSTANRTKVTEEYIRELHKGRVLSLYAVDDAVERTVAALKQAGVYENTVLAFVSDNGNMMGEHRARGKNVAYQESVRVPLMLMGPGLAAGVVRPDVATLVDIPATLSGLTGVPAGRIQDGMDVRTIPPNRAVLIQAGDRDRVWNWRGVYTQRYTAAWHYTDEAEVYDRNLDPWELNSIHDNAGRVATVASLRAVYDQLRDCKGSSCLAVHD